MFIELLIRVYSNLGGLVGKDGMQLGLWEHVEVLQAREAAYTEAS